MYIGDTDVTDNRDMAFALGIAFVFGNKWLVGLASGILFFAPPAFTSR